MNWIDRMNESDKKSENSNEDDYFEFEVKMLNYLSNTMKRFQLLKNDTQLKVSDLEDEIAKRRKVFINEFEEEDLRHVEDTPENASLRRQMGLIFGKILEKYNDFIREIKEFKSIITQYHTNSIKSIEKKLNVQNINEEIEEIPLKKQKLGIREAENLLVVQLEKENMLYDRFALIDENKNELQILGLDVRDYKSYKLVLLVFDSDDGELKNEFVFEGNGTLQSSCFLNNSVFVVIEYRPDHKSIQYNLVKLDNRLGLLDYIQVDGMNDTFCLANDDRHLYLVGLHNILQYDLSLNFIKSFPHSIKNFQAFDSRTFIRRPVHILDDKMIICGYGDLLILSKEDASLIESIHIDDISTIGIAKDYYLSFDNYLFKNIITKKDYGNNLIEKYQLLIDNSKHVSDILIDDKKDYVYLWNHNYQLIVMKPP